MQVLALTLAFLLELIAFVSFACIGLLLKAGGAVHIALGLILFVLLITFWSMYMAPRAAHKLKPVPYYIAKSVIYSVSALTIFTQATATWGVIFIVLVLVDEIALFRHNLAR